MRSPGGGELSLSACPGVGNRPPSEKKIANPRGYARGGMVTGRIEPCITAGLVCAIVDFLVLEVFNSNNLLSEAVVGLKLFYPKSFRKKFFTFLKAPNFM